MTNRTRNENRGEYPWNWRRVSYRVKRLHGFRCERCGHPHVPSPKNLRGIADMWASDWEVTEVKTVRWIGRANVHPLSADYAGRFSYEATPCDCFCDHLPDDKQRTLTVHHLDGDKSNVKFWNLAALCQVCHLQIQAKVCWDQTYLGDHSEWMQWHIERYRRDCDRKGIEAGH